MKKKICMIPTSGDNLKGIPTGLWLEEFAAPYYMFVEQGYEIVVASSKGGPVPIDTGSMQGGFFTPAAQRLMLDPIAFDTLSHSIPLGTLSFPGDFDAIYIPGGHGAGVDYVGNPTLKAAIESMDQAKRIIATVCHGPMCLIECTKEDGITPFVSGRKVTGFTDSEEAVVQKTDIVPYLIESSFKEQGGIFERAEDWHPKAILDGGNLITGQNPQSSEAAAELVIQLLNAE